MSKINNDNLLLVETTCGSLLLELQMIWDEVGEKETDRDKMLLELERECLEIYRKSVDKANKHRAQLRQEIADCEAELAAICSAMGERPVHICQSNETPGSLKEELIAILPQIEEMRKRKCERRNQFVQILKQIQKISNEVHCFSVKAKSSTLLDESDLALRKLEDLGRELHSLQKEKSDRLEHVMELLNTLKSLCSVLGVDFNRTVNEVHPSLVNNSDDTKNLSNDTIQSLTTVINDLLELKMQRMQQLQNLATSMLELWNLMDIPIEEQQIFRHVTCKIAASEIEMIEPKMLSSEFINDVELEVSRLNELKSSKMKELVLKKRLDLEEICRRTHLIPHSNVATNIAIQAIESGAVDPACVLEQIELQIAKVKDEGLSRKEILEKVDKWLGSCEEECWLEEYNRDENRYNAGRGAHLILKRAEKARILVNKLPGMVEALTSRTIAWEKEMGIQFSYDGIRLLSMLEEYAILRKEKELERKRERDHKKLQGQLITEREALFGSKPTPMKLQNGKKDRRLSTGGAPNNRRLTLGGTNLQNNITENFTSVKKTPSTTRQIKKMDDLRINDSFSTQTAVIARASESPIRRKPFSPLSSTESSKSNLVNFMEELNQNPNDQAVKKTLQINNNQLATPIKTIFANHEENRTPKTMPIPVPHTPSTISIPMQTAVTPACFVVPHIMKPLLKIVEEIEYSYEERRVAFVLNTHMNTVLQV